MDTASQEPDTFWTHFDVLRKVIFRCLIAWAMAFVVAFCFREPLFDIVFWPAHFGPEVQFVSLELTSQFMVHLQVAMMTALLVVTPYMLLELYRFVAPGLYDREKRVVLRVLPPALLCFYAGLALSYFVLFPFTFHFLASYEVSDLVVNQFSIRSYVYTLLMLSLVMGLLFEMPVVAYLLGRLGIVKAEYLAHYRRHAFVFICIVAAVITPTGDAFTLLIVTLPLYLLYELSILTLRLS